MNRSIVTIVYNDFWHLFTHKFFGGHRVTPRLLLSRLISLELATIIHVLRKIIGQQQPHQMCMSQHNDPLNWAIDVKFPSMSQCASKIGQQQTHQMCMSQHNEPLNCAIDVIFPSMSQCASK